MKLLFFIWFLAFTPVLMALDTGKAVSYYNVQVWNMESGLPGNAVFALRQTSDGYLWIGTQDGLVRFDGIDFEIFTRDMVPQLESDDIRALYEDRTGVLWIGTSTGGLTRCKDGQFTTYPAAENNALSRIRAIAEDRRGNLWIGSFTGGLTCFKNDRFITYSSKQGLPGSQVRFMYMDENQDLWVTFSTGIVKVLEPGNFQTHATHDVLPYLKTAGLYEALTGNLWIGTGESGLFRMKNGIATPMETGAKVPASTINTLYKDRRENLWIGTDAGGLIRSKGEVCLACGSVYAITGDREGSLWVGTLDRGLYQLRESKFVTYTTADGLSHDIVNCICAGRDNVTWIGTEGGVDRVKDGKPVTILTTGSGLLNRAVSCLNEDSAGNLWIGTWGGLYRYKDGEFTALTTRNGLSDNRIKCLFQDKQGNTWIGTENGLNRYDKASGQFTVYTTGQGLSGNSIEFIYEDSRGDLLIGTNAGLDRLSGGIISPYGLPVNKGDHSHKCAYEDKAGRLWIGTDRGLTRAPGKGEGGVDGGPHKKNTCNRLTENEVKTILEDDRGNLWLAGRKGITRVAVKELTDFAAGKIPRVYAETYNEKDGMKSRWVIGPGCKTRDGRLWFPSSMGVAVIDPNALKTNEIPQAPVIEKFMVDGESIIIKSFSGGPGGRFFKKAPLAAEGKLELPPGKKRLDFHYTVVSFIYPREIRYKIKLEGFDSDWVEVGNLRNAAYSGLSPGHYTFFVTAGHQDGRWSSEVTSLSFYLRPYFYQTAWFYIAAFLFVLSALFGVVKWRHRSLEREKRKLEEIVIRRTKKINDQNVRLERQTLQLAEQSGKLKELDEMKSRFFANISHEFRTPLTLIMGPLEQILSENPGKEMEARADLMLRNSRRLLNLVDELLDLAKFESGKMPLRVSSRDIISFVKNITMCFESLADQKKVTLTFQGEEEPVLVYFDPEKMEKIISNLLSNAFNYTPEGGEIGVSVCLGDAYTGYPAGCVEIAVRDTGTGISADELPYIFDRFYRGKGSHSQDRKGAGIGLALSKDMVELHHGDIRVNSSRGETQPRGTEFIIRLPMGKDHLQFGEIVDQGDNSQLPVLLDSQVTNSNKNFCGGPGGGFYKKSPLVAEGKMKEEKPIILVVEDNADVRTYIKESFKTGFEVVEAVDGKQGTFRAKEVIPDLIICDIKMPGMDGYEVCRALKNDILTSHIPIIILTARVEEESVLRGLKAGADDYITKPFSTALLSVRVNNLVSLRRRMQLEYRNRAGFLPGEIVVSPLDDEFYKKLQDAVETHLSDPDFNVETLSREMQMSRATLYRKVQALTGKNPNSFISSYRLKRAAQFLQAGAGNIAEAAGKVGFLDKSYFSKCFKEQFHCLPSEVRPLGEQGIVENREDGTTDNRRQRTDDRYQVAIETTTNEKFLQGGPGGAVFSKSAPPWQEIILIVEDSEEMRSYLRRSLEPGYRVVEAVDGIDGMARAVEVVPDLIISDIMMPGMDGYELCRVLKNDTRTCHIPIVLLTAKASEESIIRGLETGADDYIIKPFNLKILQVRIANLLRLRGHLQQDRDREMALLPVKITEAEIDREFIKELNAVIEKNMDDSGFNVEQLAGKLYMDRSTLYRKVIAITGESLADYIRSQRLKRGAQLLESNFGDVTAVAMEVGFSSSSYFAKCFKEVFHRSPSDYQASMRK